MKLRSALKKGFADTLGRRTKLISDEAYVKILYFIEFGRFPELNTPSTFNEHICKLKISDEAEELYPYIDKYAVRSYVSECVGDEYLNRIYGVYKNSDKIPFDSLPNSFALKATHASGYNIIVTDKTVINKEEIKKKFDRWLATNYYTVGRERNYNKVEPKILAEQYIRFSGAMQEFKIFCFRGVPKIISVNMTSNGKRTCDLFDADLNWIPVRYGYSNARPDLPPKKKMDELLFVARCLSTRFPFVRVDLYYNEGKIIFSELTFTSGGGIVAFAPSQYDEIFGKYFEVE